MATTPIAFTNGLSPLTVTGEVGSAAVTLRSITVTSQNAAMRYLQLFDTTTALAGGETPLVAYPINPGSSTNLSNISLGEPDFGPNGLYFDKGLIWAVSTTLATYTAATAADHTVNGFYQA
jgi:hypothetical protein